MHGGSHISPPPPFPPTSRPPVPHAQIHNTENMGNVHSTCFQDGAERHVPLVASNPGTGAAEYLAELDEAHDNAALARQLAEAKAEVRALRAQAEEEGRSTEAKNGGGVAASTSEEYRLRLDDEAERQGAKDREVIKALRVELEQARKDRADEEKVVATGGGGAPYDILVEMKVRRR